MSAANFKQIFIIGAPRSGTTFLAGLLSHTEYGEPIETHFITKYYALLDKYGDLSHKKNFAALIGDIGSERPIMQWGRPLDSEYLYERTQPAFSFADIVNEIMALRSKPGLNPHAWGDKTPHYIGNLNILMELFPAAKFVHIVRDGRDVCLSLLEKEWGPNNVYMCAEYWKRLNSQDHLIEELRRDNRLRSIKYEELVTRPKPLVTELYEFLGAELDDETIETLCHNIMSKNFDKWKTKMTERQKSVFQSVAGEKLAQFGYEPSGSGRPISAWRRTAYRIDDRLRWAVFMFKTNVIDGFRIKFLGKQPFNE